MKRCFATLIMLSMLVSLLVNVTVLAELPGTDPYSTVIWFYDFETNTPTEYLKDWDVKEKETDVIVSDPVIDGTRGKVAVFPRNGDIDNLAGPKYNLVDGQYTPDQLKHAKITCDLLLNDKFAVNIRLIDLAASAVNLNLVAYNTKGQMTFLNGPILPYEPNTWNSFVVYVNFSNTTPTYTAYLNGNMVCRNIPLTNSEGKGMTAFKTVRFQIPPNSSRAEMGDLVYIDNWGYYVGEESLEFSEPEEPVPPVIEPSEDGYNYTVWSEGFEACPLETTINNSNSNLQNTIPDSEVVVDDEAHGQVLKVPVRTSNTPVRSKYAMVVNEFPTGSYDQIGQAKLTVDIKFTKFTDAYLEMLTNTTNNFMHFINFTKEGKMQYRLASDGNLQYVDFDDYEEGTWYSFVIYVDSNTSTYTAYVNDNLIVKNTPYFTKENTDGIRAMGVYIIKAGEDSEEDPIADKIVYIDNMSITTLDRWPYEEKTVFHDDFDGNYTAIEGLETYPSNYYRMYGKSCSITTVPKYGSDGVFISPTDPERGNVMRLDVHHAERSGNNTERGYFDTVYDVIRSNYPDNDGKRLTKLKVEFDLMVEPESRVVVTAHNYPQGFYKVFAFNADGTITICGDDGPTPTYNMEVRSKYGTYEPYKWYNIKIYIEIDENITEGGNSLCTVFINDEKLGSGKIHNTINFIGIDSIRIEGALGDYPKYAYVDNFKMDTRGEPVLYVTKEYEDETTVEGRVSYRLNPRISDTASLIVTNMEDKEMKNVSVKNMDMNNQLSVFSVIPYSINTDKYSNILLLKDLTTLQPIRDKKILKLE